MMIYCPKNGKKVEVRNFTERIVTINHGQRKLVEGVCPTHGTKVAMYVPMNTSMPSSSAPKRVIHKRKARSKKYNSLYYM